MANVPIKSFVSFIHKRFFSVLPSKSLKSAVPTATDTTSETNSVVIPHSILSSFTVQYLVNSCGLPLKTAISISKRLQLDEKNKDKIDSVVSFLKSHNFSDTQVAKLVVKNPTVLNSKLSRNLEPRIQFLAENGISGSVLPKILLSNSALLNRSLDSHLKPAFEFLKKYIGSSDMIQLVICRSSWIINFDLRNTLQRNVDYLIRQGVPMNRVRWLIVLQPRSMCQEDKMVHSVEKVNGLGLKPNDAMFIYALRVILSLSESSWKRKVGIFKGMGWSYDDVLSTFVRCPYCLSCSEEKLRRAVDFLVNTAKIELKYIIANPKSLLYSVERRMIPRYTIWKVLVERKLVKGAKFSVILKKSEKIFIAHYITKYSDTIPDILKIYENSKKTRNIVV